MIDFIYYFYNHNALKLKSEINLVIVKSNNSIIYIIIFSDYKFFLIFLNIKELWYEKIEKIYLRNPVEFYSQIDYFVNKLYNIEPIIIFNKSTKVDSHLIKNNENYSAAIIINFGFGKVLILSCINFSDYDIDNLDNKKWIVSLFKYLSKNESFITMKSR